MTEMGTLVVTNKTMKINPYMLPDLSEMYEINAREGLIVIRPASQSCVFCGRIGTVEHMDKVVCNNCIQGLKSLKPKGSKKRGQKSNK